MVKNQFFSISPVEKGAWLKGGLGVVLEVREQQ